MFKQYRSQCRTDSNDNAGQNDIGSVSYILLLIKNKSIDYSLQHNLSFTFVSKYRDSIYYCKVDHLLFSILQGQRHGSYKIFADLIKLRPGFIPVLRFYDFGYSISIH